MSVLWHRSPDIRLRIFIKLDSLNVNKTEKDSHGKRSGLFLLFHIYITNKFIKDGIPKNYIIN